MKMVTVEIISKNNNEVRYRREIPKFIIEALESDYYSVKVEGCFEIMISDASRKDTYDHSEATGLRKGK